MKFIYPANISKVGKREFVVSFPDVPEALTSGETETEALEEAQDCLNQALLFYLKDGRQVPAPSPLKGAEYAITPDPVIAMKAALHTAVAEAKVPAATMYLARALKVDKSEAMRILNPEHRTKADRMNDALAVFGRAMVVSTRVLGQRGGAAVRSARSGGSVSTKARAKDRRKIA